MCSVFAIVANLEVSEPGLSLRAMFAKAGSLKGVVDYAATMASTTILTADCLPSFMRETAGDLFTVPETDRQPLENGAGQGLLNRTLQEVERTLIKKVLSESRTRSEAIKTLGISRRAFYLKIKKYGL